MRAASTEATSELDTRLAESVGRMISANVVGSHHEPTSDSFAMVEQRLARRRSRARRLGVTAAVAVVAVGAYWGRVHFVDRGGERITYRVEGGQAQQEGNLIADTGPSGPTEVRFSDGTQMRMEPRTRGRVVDLDRRGGKVTLYQGKAHIDVRHRPNARWLFQAGPFEVRVHGTSFSLSWNAASSRFDLQMESGVVSVAGPISGGEIVLRAGQTLSVDLGEQGAGAGAGRPVGSAGSDRAAADEAGPGTAPPPVAETAVGLRPEAARAPMDWRAELTAGHAGAVVADAERRGLGRVLGRAESEDLAALADAARYVGRDDLARRVLHEQRRRFPRSKRAAEASFLLGRLEDESAGGAARALAWYDRYLAEAPSGAYVSEAIGRKMMVLERTKRHEDAVALAADYLRRFPTGSYAHAAGVVVGSSRSGGVEGSQRAP